MRLYLFALYYWDYCRLRWVMRRVVAGTRWFPRWQEAWKSAGRSLAFKRDMQRFSPAEQAQARALIDKAIDELKADVICASEQEVRS